VIPLELKWALLLYAGILGAMALFIWLYTELTVWRPHRYLGQQFLWRCTFCGYTYLDESDDRFSACPRCHSINSADDPHARFVPARAGTSPEPAPALDADIRRNPSHRKRPHQRRRGPRKR
jgi:hypothetical protein